MDKLERSTPVNNRGIAAPCSPFLFSQAGSATTVQKNFHMSRIS